MALDLGKVRETLLLDHNKVRALHRVGALRANVDLDLLAQKWADHLASINRLQHGTSMYQGNNPVGENLFCAYNTTKTPEDIAIGATAKWYSEKDNFNWSNPEGSLSGCGHFTQVVWRSSKEVGFGVARSNDGYIYVVGQFFPAGNFIGQVAKNVIPPENDQERPHFTETLAGNNNNNNTNKALLPEGNVVAAENNNNEKGGDKPTIKTETKRQVKDETINGRRVRTTVTTEVQHFANGSTRTSTHTQTETFSSN